MIVLCTYFNPQHSAITLSNYKRFRSALNRQEVVVWTAELVLDDDKPEISDAILKVQSTRKEAVPWQKERLINILINLLTDCYIGNVAWMDADVILLNDKWVEIADAMLCMYPVVQLFSQAYYLDRISQLKHERTSAAALYQKSTPYYDDFIKAQPGLAWAARLDVLRGIGLYENMITGSGDTVAFRGFTGTAQLRLAHLASQELQADIAKWCAAMYDRVQGKVGCVPGTALHLYHGELANRRYEDRWRLLEDFNPHTQLAPHPSQYSPLLWSSTVPEVLRRHAMELLESSRL
jgi:hypothetical protein